MPTKTRAWVQEMPTFLGLIESAKTEKDIVSACASIKKAVVATYPRTPDSRRNPMREIREAIRVRYPAVGGKSNHESVPFPYYFTKNGKGNIERWEHLAIKHLSEEWNPGKEPERTEPVKPVEPTESLVKEFAEPVELDQEESKSVLLLATLGLSDEELEGVQNAIASSGLSELEWLKKAVIGRAKQQTAIRKWQGNGDELATVSSEELMNDSRYRTNPNVCHELTSRAVRALKDWNYQNPENKLCVTNNLISELTGNTPKAIVKVTERMDLEGYNQAQQLTPVKNRLVKQRLGIDSFTRIISIKDYLGIE